jgi:hypothetical protein
MVVIAAPQPAQLCHVGSEEGPFSERCPRAVLDWRRDSDRRYVDDKGSDDTAGS